MPSKRNYCPCLEQFFVKFLSRAHFPGLMVQTSGNKCSSGILLVEGWYSLNYRKMTGASTLLCLIPTPLHQPAGSYRQGWESSSPCGRYQHIRVYPACITKSWTDQPSFCWRREISQSKAVWQPSTLRLLLSFPSVCWILHWVPL